MLNALEEGKGVELLIDKIRTTKDNDEFLARDRQGPHARGLTRSATPHVAARIGVKSIAGAGVLLATAREFRAPDFS